MKKSTKAFAIIILLFNYGIAVAQQNADSTKTNPTDSTTSALVKDIKNVSKSSEKIIPLAISIGELDSVKNTLNKEIDSLQRKNKITKMEDDKISKKIKKAKEINEELELKKKELNTELEKMQTQLNNVKENIDTLTYKQGKLIREIDSLSKKNTEISDHALLLAAQAEQNAIAISKQKDSLETIGDIDMKDSVYVFLDAGKNGYKTKVNKVHLRVKEGIILEIIVNTDSGIFRNKRATIDLLHFGERISEKLFYEQTLRSENFGSSKYIEIGSVISYTPYRSYNAIPYAEFDITLFPETENKSYPIRESTSLNSYFEIAAFTDIKGISGDANGLAQFTAEAKFITNTRNLKNVAIVPFNFISFHGGVSKFDNDFKGTEIKVDTINRKDLLQRSNYSIGIKANLLRTFASPRPRHLFNDIQLNIGYNFLGGKVYDTLFKDDARTVIDTVFKSVSQGQVYIQPSISLSRNHNFSMTISLPFFFNSVMKSSGIVNRKTEYWFSPSLLLMYFSKRDSGSKLFFRYNHFINLKEPVNAFTQLQLGYSLNLSDILNKK